MSEERERLEEARRREKHWRRWGPYLSERAWGTVREDYSRDGSAWEYLSHDAARSRAYRWGEDGLGGICDNHQRLCLALALWNEQDPILKERLFGLTNHEGNHGEDVKECYWYLDGTPTGSWLRFLYKYPQRRFPYEELVRVNAGRGRDEPEYELLDTGVFDEDRYFDVFVEAAKADVDDIAVRIRVVNRGPDPAPLHVLPTLWFRNTWSYDPRAPRPRLSVEASTSGLSIIRAEHATLGERRLHLAGDAGLLFTENETNRALTGAGAGPYVKDAFHRFIISGEGAAVNPACEGTKAAAHCRRVLAPGETWILPLRLCERALSAVGGRAFAGEIEGILRAREEEADRFHAALARPGQSEEARSAQRQALAGLFWSRQFYHYDVSRWLDEGADGGAAVMRHPARNAGWRHLYNEDVVSMPDKWEYPWYATWDLAFHCAALALADPDSAKDQLLLFLREWYQHPNGQLPAYEWNFSDVNPPVHAWAVWNVYRRERRRYGRADRAFLERAFHKLLLYFTWWVNRKDERGNNLFQGGFLGLDNIGVFDRSAQLPGGGTLQQSDATAWMGLFSLNMLGIAMELAEENPAYADIASKFFEHFVHISHAMNHMGVEGIQLWDEDDGFFYDALCFPDGSRRLIKIRSLVGLIPLFALKTLEGEAVDRLPGFRRRLEWFLRNRPYLVDHVDEMPSGGGSPRRLLSLVSPQRLSRVLSRVLDENEFLSAHGVRSLSRYHKDHPFVLRMDGQEHRIDYEPAESTSAMFGGNSNWRGPVWAPVNALLVEALRQYHEFLGDGFMVECPTGSGRRMHLGEVADEIASRLGRLFLPDGGGRRPCNGGNDRLDLDPRWSQHVWFHEYFHGEDGRGLGASHQTGWTALAALLTHE